MPPNPDGVWTRFVTANDTGSALVAIGSGQFFVWGPGGGFTALGRLPDHHWCGAEDLNDRGAVTGACTVRGRDLHALRWDLPVIGNG
ncbi:MULTISPECIES: hypothetical protein [Amycolatopsis]|uniref:Uncharacterized protein n=1 Tax=Amycolatopsis bullii TaxID=941987 RepID=A0ABQ3K7U9_9PSEU|nr:hypothetical protein [Amycolatopsis bullii]GHG06957.1 hypothetical protein GCM10017567_24120 [Amycolatopsis bullii]